MKRFVCVMLFLVMLVTSCSAFASVSTDGVVKYKGLALIDFHLRASPDNDGRRLQEVPKGIKLSILEWDDSWCLATYKGFTGYAKTEWLYRIQSMDAMKYPFPAFDHKMTGYVTFNDEMLLQAGEFKGVTTQAGQLACVEANADKSEFYLPIWRDAMLLSDGVTYHPFVAWNKATPGDMIGGFTTFYGDQLGKRYVEGRAHNIEVGCERMSVTVEPQAEFSFNALCGPYRKSNGYAMAPNVSEEGKGYGGGVCQVTTTLYNAILSLPLQITNWSIHKYTGVLYVPQFFDAAVGTYSDLSFTNLLPYAIRLEALPQDGILTVLIYRAE